MLRLGGQISQNLRLREFPTRGGNGALPPKVGISQNPLRLTLEPVPIIGSLRDGYQNTTTHPTSSRIHTLTILKVIDHIG
ncbi:unnamed protein product [marine sediment metagenome]|uniref:Uncharacterized protein n=1 Tax=marine sediment metagenome TaxID=412755 RepID=X1KUY3_9ZZZZ